MILNIFIVLGSIIVIMLLLALFVNKNYKVEREIAINKPVNEVFTYIRYLKNQDSYNKWIMRDPRAKKEFTGTDGTVGFIYAWDSDDKHMGKGEQEIRKVKQDERMDLELRFKKPFEDTANVYFITEAAGEKLTNVKWAMEGSNNYPRNLMNLFMDKMLGGDLETSLGTLKTVIEKQ
jgi:uncharacterized protein YndB with AHSA1/START domain